MFVSVKDLVVDKEYYLTDRPVNSKRARGIFKSLDEMETHNSKQPQS